MDKKKQTKQFSSNSAYAHKLSEQWFEKYLQAGEITPELEAERDRIMRVMFAPQYQR